MTRAGVMVRRLAAGAWANSLLRRIAAARGNGLALVYHRVGPPGGGAVPTISEDLLARHLGLLKRLGSIVPVEELLRPDPSGPVRFALTFDDDYRSHVERVLPALIDEGVHATFFLSGRSLFGLAQYPFEAIDDLLNASSADEVAGTLGIEARDVEALLFACASDRSIARRVEALPQTPPDHLRPEDIKELVGAGMTVGFHTLEHPALTSLPDGDLEDAIERGRAELEAVAGAPVRLFAYPFGRTDPRVSGAVARAGYVAAFSGVPGPITGRTDRFRVPRWEPGPLGADDFLTELAIRLHRSARKP